MTVARSFHEFSEVLLTATAKARSMQTIAEALVSAAAKARSCQTFIEVLGQKTSLNARSHQEFIEVLMQKDSIWARSYQTFVEVLCVFIPEVYLSDEAIAGVGFEVVEPGTILLQDVTTDALVTLYGTMESPPVGGEVNFSDVAIAGSGILMSNPTAVLLQEFTYASATFWVSEEIYFTDVAVARSRVRSMLNGNPGILASGLYRG